MKTILIGFVALISMSLFFSCQREIDNMVTNRLQNDSVLLDRLVFLDTTFIQPNDSTSWYKFLYDSRKRVSKIFYVENNIGTLDTTDAWEFFYIDNDSLPDKTQYQRPNSYGTTYIFYDNTGRVIKDSSLDTYVTGMHTLAVNNYRYGNSSVIIESDYDSGPGNIYHYLDTIFQTKIGRNILTESYASYSGAEYAVSLNYRYDNHPNPLKKIHLAHYPYYEGEDLIEDNWSDNNFLETYTERKYLNPPSIIDIDHHVYTYLYDSNGMPKIAWEREVNVGIMNKYAFIYTQ